MNASPPAWPDQLFDTLKRGNIRQVGYVPDAGTEEEGIALAAGAWLGGERAALLMQSSGVGNCINMLSLMRSCSFPLVTFITMRGEWEEFNPWQVPMGSIVEPVMKLCDAEVYRAMKPEDVPQLAERAVQKAFGEERVVAVLLSQQLIGKKVWVK
jgi:sulfopyruvate decarboxylase TPP-binding subunit